MKIPKWKSEAINRKRPKEIGQKDKYGSTKKQHRKLNEIMKIHLMLGDTSVIMVGVIVCCLTSSEQL